jgi:hypothetical protein
MIDTGFYCGIQSGQKVFSFDTGTEAGLESVTERAVHEFDFFHFFNSPVIGIIKL